MVRIEIATLNEGLNQQTVTPTAESLELDENVFSDVRVTVELDVAADRIVARYATLADAHLVCDRTAEPFVQQVEGSHLVLFSTGEGADSEDEKGDVRVFSKADRYLDLTNEVRDTLVLSLPARRVAPGAEEVDIPTTFGQDEGEATDPRWDELKKLQN